MNRDGPAARNDRGSSDGDHQSQGGFTRRHFWPLATLALGGAGLGGLALHRFLSRELTPEQQQVADILDRFPTRVPGSELPSGVRKMIVPESHHCLIHIRDIHGIDWMLNERIEAISNSLPDDLRRIFIYGFETGSIADVRFSWFGDTERQRVQTLLDADETKKLQRLYNALKEPPNEAEGHIAEIVAFLGSEFQLREIHVEGYETAQTDNFPDLVRSMRESKATERAERDILAKAALAGLRGPDLGADLIDLADDLEHRRIRHLLLEKTTADRLGSLAPLFWSGEITVRAGNYPPLREPAIGHTIRDVVTEQGGTPDSTELVFHAVRETMILWHGRSAPITVLRFGGSHDFSRVISAWNKHSPNDTYSLIEITPQGYGRNVRDPLNDPDIQALMREFGIGGSR